MPDVGLFTATDPLPEKARVIIKYSVEVDGLPVYTETYDVAKLARELDENKARAVALWARRIQCAVACRARPGFSSALTRCLADGQACDCGFRDCRAVEA
jgi:hypothetical protein